MTAVEDAISKILHDTRVSSRTCDAIRHPLFAEIRAGGISNMPALFALLKDSSSPHLMGMIFELAGDKAPEIPDEERGIVRKMRERLLDWGKAQGYLPQ